MNTTTKNFLRIGVLCAGLLASSIVMARGYAGTYSGEWQHSDRWNDGYNQEWRSNNLYGNSVIETSTSGSVCDENGNCWN